MPTALITGASAGIGAEFAAQLAEEGYDLVLVARRAERLESLGASLTDRFGVKVLIVPADLSLPGAPLLIKQQVAEAGLEIDYLVNNAGASGPDLIRDRDWDEHEAFFRLLMTSVAHMCHLFIPDMRRRGFGRVINVASVAGLVALSGGANYGPVKRYVVGLSEELAIMVRGDGVRVTALCPGFTHTEFHDVAGLTHMKSRMPKLLWYDAAVVVREGRKAVESGRSVQVSGSLYRLVVPLLRFRPVQRIAARVGSRR
ncbi:MAG: SDR family NAD(P)-dependent oxidoreductase [Acidimicrobiia bacterium]|nr:SDR family NAD(P)-dependent oxidoreductase [Acidimicrobiia bacterium]